MLAESDRERYGMRPAGLVCWVRAVILRMSMKNRVLVILSNRLDRTWKRRHFDLVSKPDGTVLKEVLLKRPPKSRVYDEVWENDDGKTDIDSCTRMKRHYKHPLLRRRGK
jgi:hypothetical protein